MATQGLIPCVSDAGCGRTSSAIPKAGSLTSQDVPAAEGSSPAAHASATAGLIGSDARTDIIAESPLKRTSQALHRNTSTCGSRSKTIDVEFDWECAEGNVTLRLTFEIEPYHRGSLTEDPSGGGLSLARVRALGLDDPPQVIAIEKAFDRAWDSDESLRNELHELAWDSAGR